MQDNKVRVRFAPSPTGALHIGGVPTALYNYLFARKHGGKFLLRIEDTDQTRFVPGAEAYILDTLHWLGLDVDEGPVQGGPAGPYRQSERKALYRGYANQLVEAGVAYYAFDTPEALEAMRTHAKGATSFPAAYNAMHRVGMRNSLALPREEVAAMLREGVPYVVRIKVDPPTSIRFHDLIRGWVKVAASTLDDKVLLKADGTPTYHFANVVDDHLMGITHVIREEEWLASTPFHVLLYQYLGWEASMPQFAHLPLLLKPEGMGKLSKRDADQRGTPIFPLAWEDPTTGERVAGFREHGYLPEALINFLALLGWNPGHPQELFSKEELVEAFSIERIGKSGIKFDMSKAAWFNQQYLRTQPDEVLVKYLLQDLEAQEVAYTPLYALRVGQLVKERAVFPGDLWRQGQFFFVRPTSYDIVFLKKKWQAQMGATLQDFLRVLRDREVEPFEAAAIKAILAQLLATTSIPLGHFMQVVRVALMGVGVGPDLMQSMELLGRKECTERLHAFLRFIPLSDTLDAS